MPPINGSDDTRSQHSATESSLKKTDKAPEAVKPEVYTGHESSE